MGSVRYERKSLCLIETVLRQAKNISEIIYMTEPFFVQFYDKTGDLMMQSRILVALTILIVGALLAPGCVSSSPAPVAPAENTSTIITRQATTTEPPVATQTPVLCVQESNTTPPEQNLFISINPIPDHYLGDTITFEGITNLPTGEIITIMISEGWGRCGKCQTRIDSVRYCCGNFNRAVAVRQGVCGMNFWSLDVNTSYHDFHPYQYWIGMFGRNHHVENASLFNVSNQPEPNPFRYITINLPEKVPEADAIRLSGTVNTDNGPREMLILQISSDFENRTITRTVLPVVFDGTGYKWNFTLNASTLNPGNFTVNITSLYNPRTGNRRVFTI